MGGGGPSTLHGGTEFTASGLPPHLRSALSGMAVENQIGVAYPIHSLFGSTNDFADLASEGTAVRMGTAVPSDAVSLAGGSAGDLGVLFGRST